MKTTISHLPVKPQLQTLSQVTILKLSPSILQQPKDIENILRQRYNTEQRRHIIVDRSHGKIIDTRIIDIDQQLSSSAYLPSSKIKKQSNLGDDFIQQHLSVSPCRPQNKNNTSIWQDNWKQVDKTHHLFLSAILNNQPQVIQDLFKQNNIDVNYKFQSGWTPIHHAAMHPNIQIIGRLISHPRIDVNSLTQFGETPLHIAVKANKIQNCLLLIGAGVCIDKKDNDGYSALHYAAEFSYKQICMTLIQEGASCLLKNGNGMTPPQLASRTIIDIFPKQCLTLQNCCKNLTEQQQQEKYLRSRLDHRRMIEKMLGSRNEQVPRDLQKTNKQKQKMNNRQKNIFKMFLYIKEKQRVQNITLSSFKFYKRIGEGAFGQVYLVRKQGNQKLFALKAIKKQRVFGTSLYRYIQTQKEILSLINHPFIVKLRYAFQTQTYLFLVMDFCQGGDLSKLLQKRKKFQERYVRNYACQILLGLQALHKNNILYRDLKPQNIVLDKDGHALITDFGLSKRSDNLDDLNKSFCGTPAYLPLQIINKKGHNRMADWYQFGVVLYELYTGIPPFYADTKSQLYQLVRGGVIRFPKNTPDVFRDLIKKLLCQNPQKRLGFQKDAQSIKQHPWFSQVEWQSVLQRKLVMPVIDNKIKIGEPIKTKFNDIKSQKYQIPMWSFAQ